MRIALIYIQVRYEQPEGPEVNVSRYAMRPGTLGMTLAKIKTAASKGRFRVKRLHPGSFSAQTARSSKRDPRDVRC